MIEIELELTSNERKVKDVFQKLAELLRNAESQGFNVKEVEVEVENDEDEQEAKVHLNILPNFVIYDNNQTKNSQIIRETCT